LVAEEIIIDRPGRLDSGSMETDAKAADSGKQRTGPHRCGRGLRVVELVIAPLLI